MYIKHLSWVKITEFDITKVDFSLEGMQGCCSNRNMLNNGTNYGSQNCLNLFVLLLRPQHIPGKQMGECNL